ncbi:MAG: flagellin [Clostridia bacterium]|nr:flagellin [Clostridia bacterium]
MSYSTTLGIANIYKNANKSYDAAMKMVATGKRINSAADDPAGLSISEKMKAQIRGLNQASKNAQNGISLLNVAEGAMGEQENILHRIRELAVQAATDTNADTDREALQAEVNQLLEEINRIGGTTEFNGMPLLDGSKMNKLDGDDNALYIHVGANANQAIAIEIGEMNSAAMGIASIDITSREGANAAIDAIDGAIKIASRERSKLGAYTNRLEFTISNLETQAENMTAAESRISDADMAQAVMEMAKSSIMSQVAQAMLAQSMKNESLVLKLLEGLNG